jgi:hypothetical protein
VDRVVGAGAQVTLGDLLANFVAAAALRTVFNAAEPGGYARDTAEGEALRVLADRVYRDVSAGRVPSGKVWWRAPKSARCGGGYDTLDHDILDKLSAANTWTVYWIEGCGCAPCQRGAYWIEREVIRG